MEKIRSNKSEISSAVKLLYIANSRIPTEKAHGLQILKMCHLFAVRNIDLTLILPKRKNPSFSKENIFDYYKIEENFKIRKLWTIDPRFLLKFPAGTYIKFQSLFFIVRLFFYFIFLKNRTAVSAQRVFDIISITVFSYHPTFTSSINTVAKNSIISFIPPIHTQANTVIKAKI